MSKQNPIILDDDDFPTTSRRDRERREREETERQRERERERRQIQRERREREEIQRERARERQIQRQRQRHRQRQREERQRQREERQRQREETEDDEEDVNVVPYVPKQQPKKTTSIAGSTAVLSALRGFHQKEKSKKRKRSPKQRQKKQLSQAQLQRRNQQKIFDEFEINILNLLLQKYQQNKKLLKQNFIKFTKKLNNFIDSMKTHKSRESINELFDDFFEGYMDILYDPELNSIPLSTNEIREKIQKASKSEMKKLNKFKEVALFLIITDVKKDILKKSESSNFSKENFAKILNELFGIIEKNDSLSQLILEFHYNLESESSDEDEGNISDLLDQEEDQMGGHQDFRRAMTQFHPSHLPVLSLQKQQELRSRKKLELIHKKRYNSGQQQQSSGSSSQQKQSSRSSSQQQQSSRSSGQQQQSSSSSGQQQQPQTRQKRQQ